MTIIDDDVASILRVTDLKFFQGKDVLITGASGLIGIYLSATLQQLQSKGVGPARIFLSTMSGNFPHPVGNSVEVIQGDLTKFSVIDALPYFDIIIHAAGYAQPQKFLEKPLLTISLNTTVTMGLISKVNPGGRFLFISSSEVYAGLLNPPFTEDQIGTSRTDHPRSAYIEGKRCGEAITFNANLNKGLTASSCRLSLAYGPGTKFGDTRVLNSFIHQALVLQKITLMDSGEAWRTYCYVSDAVEMCLAVLSDSSGGIYNVAGESRIRIVDLAYAVGKLTNARVILPPKSDARSLVGSPVDVWLNIEKVLTLSGKRKFVDFQDGLFRTIEWQKMSLASSTSKALNSNGVTPKI
jgi:UDP-glucuronate decarboxylase